MVGDGGGVGEVFAVGLVGFTVVLGGFVKEAARNGKFNLLEGERTLLVLFNLLLAEVLLNLLPLGIGQTSVGIEAALEVGEVDPGGDGGFEERELLAVAVGVVAEVGVARFDEDDRFEAEFAEDGGEEDAGVDTVGLARGEDFVEEADVLHVGARRGVGSAGDGGVGDAVVEGVVPDGEHLVADGLRTAGLIAA